MKDVRGTRTSLTVGVVAFVAGLLFATSASVFAGQESGTHRDLTSLVEEEGKRYTELTENVDELRGEIAALQAAGEVPAPVLSAGSALAVGLAAVEGPGVSVTLSDAPSTATSDNPDDLVVHQQDLQAVVNALWAGGAEAMSIQGQRVIATTAVRCVGNVLLLNGRTYSPPYRVEAIGDVSSLIRALDADPAVELYRRYVDVFGLGWNVSASDDLAIPASTGSRTLSFAEPAEEGL